MKWLGKFPDPFLTGIAGQPVALRQAAAALEDQRATLIALADAATDVHGVVLTGMGSSYDACFPAVNEFAARGVLALHVDTAELLHFRTEILTRSTLLVIVSQSGESAEVVRLADSLVERADRPTILSITNGLDNALSGRSDLRLDTRAGPEHGPSTMTFAASMTQLAAVAGAIAGGPTARAIERARAASEEAARAIEHVLDGAKVLVDRFTGAVRGRNPIAVLGRGPARAAAEMGALTLKESGVMAEAFSTAAFRHGPFELVGPSLAAIIVATELETRSLDLRLAKDLVLAGASVTLIGPDGEAPEDALEIPIDATDRLLASAASLVPIQLLSWRLASELGREPGVYLRASKVTTRE